MKLKKLLILLLAGVMAVSMAGCGGGAAEQQAEEQEQQEDTWDLVKEAYVYSYPLVLMDATKKAMTNTDEPTDRRAPINQFMHASEAASSDYQDVTSPDVDMFYSQAMLDLSNDAVVLHKPYSSRFMSIEIMDAWSNCVKILGTGGEDDGDMTYLLTGPGFKGEVPYYMTQIKLPTTMGWICARIECNGDNDISNVEYLQKNLTAEALTFYESGEEPPIGVYDEAEDFVPAEYVDELAPGDYFNRVNELMKENAGTKDDKALLDRLAAIGIGPEQTFDAKVLGEDADAKWEDLKANILPELREACAEQIVKSGGFTYCGEPIADFGTNYNYRALVAMTQFGAMPASVCVNLQADTDSEGNPLTGDEAYVLHIKSGDLPPVKDGGSWAFTAYDADGYLIDNDIDRNCINEDSEVVYNDDGSLDLYLQADEPDDENKVKNWLPVGEEEFQLSLRIYLPGDDLFEGNWKAVKVKKSKKK